LNNLSQLLADANPADASVPNRFRLQQLAGAQPTEAERKKLMADLGDDVLAAIEVDPAPFAQAVKDRQSATDYDTLYSLGNLLLISGRIAEARNVFEKLYKIAPAGEVN